MVRHGRMQAYDFGGIEQNRRRYGQTAVRFYAFILIYGTLLNR